MDFVFQDQEVAFALQRIVIVVCYDISFCCASLRKLTPLGGVNLFTLIGKKGRRKSDA